MDAVSGRVTKIRTMSNGAPRIEVELDCSLSDVAALFDVGAEAALARLAAKPETQSSNSQATGKQKGGPLAELAGQLCKSKEFWSFLLDQGLQCDNEERAKQIILLNCEIKSRCELDHNQSAAKEFHQRFRKPFMAWKALR